MVAHKDDKGHEEGMEVHKVPEVLRVFLGRGTIYHNRQSRIHKNPM
jgi:hypothetical protein